MRIRIGKGGQQTIELDPEIVIGGYAIHLRIRESRAVGPGWTVTHALTGVALWYVERYHDAVRVAQWLVEGTIFPVDISEYKELHKWWQNQGDAEQLKIRDGMSGIAVRWKAS